MILLGLPNLPIRQFNLTLVPSVRSHEAIFRGSESTVDLLEDFWTASVTFEWLTRAQAPILGTFIDMLAEGCYYTRFGHLARPTNFGTLPSSAGVKFDADKGDNVIVLYAPAAGLTLLAGDMFEVSGLLLQCAQDCISNDADEIYVPLTNTLRKSILSGAAVTLAGAAANFKPRSLVVMQQGSNFTDPVTLDFVEHV